MRNYVAHSVFLMVIITLFSQWTFADWVQTNGPYGANAEALEMLGNKLFVATFGGGIYTSIDNGNNWKESNSGITNMYLQALGACNGIILAGTDGNGIFRSTDSGTTWNRITTKSTDGYIYAFATYDATIYAGTSGGIFRSSDNGVNWSPFDTSFKNINIKSMAADGNTIFAGTSDSGIIRSTGTSLSFINPEPEYPIGSVQIVATKGNTVFAARNYSTSSKIYRSLDNGTTWNIVYPGRTNTFINSFAFNGTTVLAATTIGVLLSTDNGTTWSRSNTGLSDTIVQTLKVSGNTIFAGTESGGVFRSTDGGANWTAVNTGITNTNSRIWATSDNILFAMSGKIGGFRSIDNGTNWTPVTIALTNPYCFSFLECGDSIFAGTLQGAYFSTDTGSHWTPINFGFEGVAVRSWVKHGSEIFIGTPRGIFCSSNGGSNWKLIGLSSIYDLSVTSLLMCGDELLAATYKHGIFRLTKNDTLWSSVNTGLKDKNVECLALSGNTVIAGSFYGIFRSRDKGMTWTDTIKTSGGINSFVVLDTAIIASGSGVFCSKDTGSTWTKVTTGLPTNTANSSIPTLAICGDHLFAGVNAKGVWRRPLQEILTTPKVQTRRNAAKPSLLTFNIHETAGQKISFEFSLNQPAKVWGAIYDLSGRLVSVVINQTLGVGVHRQILNARSMSKGCYLVRIRAGESSGVKMVRLMDIKFLSN